jgi:hypothetical protein
LFLVLVLTAVTALLPTAPAGAITEPLVVTVVLTAGHCTDGAVRARLWLAEKVQTNPENPLGRATPHEGTPYTNPDSSCPGSSSTVRSSSGSLRIPVKERAAPASETPTLRSCRSW